MAGCNNDPTCVFTTGCQGDSGALAENDARAPVDGEWVVDGPPTVSDAFPTGPQQAPTTPVMLVFTETMQEESLDGAFELRPLLGGGTVGPPVLGLASALVSDGRVLLLFPPPPDGLEPGDYQLRRAQDGTPVDVTGQALGLAAGQVLASFNVTATPPAAPRLLATFPLDDALDQSATSEIVVVFDRAVQQSSVDAGSFSVEVEGVPPSNDPPAQPVNARLGVNVVPDTRAFLYRSVDPDGVAVPLGLDADVVLTLSPTGDPIREQDGGILAPTSVNFHTLRFAPPLAVTLLSQPPDAIGLANLTDGDPQELLLELELDDLSTNDSIDLVLFGEQKLENDPEPPFIALQRTLRLSDLTPITIATFTREDIGLQFSDEPDDVRFADGPVTFAFRTRRGTVVTPLVVLDLEPDPDLIQDLLLDTEAPEVETLVGSTDTESFRSDQRDLVLAGTADGELRSVEVTTPLGSNGAVPPVVGSQGPLFLAAPVPLGQLATGTTSYDFTARDVGFNAAPAAAGVFTQLGTVGPGAFAPGDTLTVLVFDGGTLLPVRDARVLVHSDLGNGTDFPFHAVATTDLTGLVNVGTDAAASAVIVTVDAAGFDLVTLHGVTSTRLSLPLTAARRAPAHATGGVTTSDGAAIALLPGLERRHDDSRRDVRLPRAFPGSSCASTGGTFACQHAATDIRALALGARSFFAGDFTQSEGSFSAAQLLQAFVLQVPQPGVPPSTDQPALLEVPQLLIDSSLPDEEAAQALPAFGLRVDPAGGVDFLALEEDPTTEGEAFATVETRVPGLGGSIAVGVGLSYDQGGGLWRIRAAQPGAVTAAGSLGADGVVDTDVSVRAEVRDVDGNAAGVRPRLSAILAGGPDPEFEALDVPTVLTPATNTGGQAFTLTLPQVIGDDRSEGGLYRVDLTDVAGRRWSLWRIDGPGAADVELRAVDLADGGGSGLADGALTLRASAWAWEAFAPAAFLWSDLEREFELFALAAERTLQKP